MSKEKPTKTTDNERRECPCSTFDEDGDVSNGYDRIKSDKYGGSRNAGIVSVGYPSVWIVK